MNKSVVNVCYISDKDNVSGFQIQLHILLDLALQSYHWDPHNFSSPSIHQISTPTSVTYEMLYNRSLLGWLLIFSLSTLLKLNLFLLYLNNNSLKYKTALALQPTSLATLVLFSTELSKSCYYHICELRCIRPYLDFKTASTIATSIVYSKLDYCNSLS